VTLSGGDDSYNLADMLHSIFEEYKRHNSVELVVFSKGQITHFSELLCALELSVKLIIERLSELGEHEGLGSRLGEVLG